MSKHKVHTKKTTQKIQGHLPQKGFGQNFLQDDNIIQNINHGICRQAKPDELIIEIGAGLGAITKVLVKKFKHLHVIELDKNLAANLMHSYPNISVYNQDVLKFNFEKFSFEQNNKMHVVGNLPYNISSPLLLYLLEYIGVIQSQYFMLQKEVIERIIASPCTKAYGRLSILLQAHYVMYKDIEVPPDAFFPQPKVDSATISMVPNIKIDIKHSKTLQYLTRICFAQRRKMLRGFVENKHLFEEYNFDLSRRAEEVSVEEYINLARWWSEHQQD